MSLYIWNYFICVGIKLLLNVKLKSIVESMQFSPEGSPLNNLYPKSFHIITVSPCCYFTTIGFITSRYWHQVLVSPCFYFTTIGVITSRYWHQVLVSPCCYFTTFGNTTARYRSPLSQGRRFWENITSFVSQIKEYSINQLCYTAKIVWLTKVL